MASITSKFKCITWISAYTDKEICGSRKFVASFLFVIREATSIKYKLLYLVTDNAYTVQGGEVMN